MLKIILVELSVKNMELVNENNIINKIGNDNKISKIKSYTNF